MGTFLKMQFLKVARDWQTYNLKKYLKKDITIQILTYIRIVSKTKFIYSFKVWFFPYCVNHLIYYFLKSTSD